MNNVETTVLLDTCLIQICCCQEDHRSSDGAVLSDTGRVGHLGEDGRVVVGVHDGDVDGGLVAQGRVAAVPGLDGQEVLLGSLVINLTRDRNQSREWVDCKFSLFISPDN